MVLAGIASTSHSAQPTFLAGEDPTPEGKTWKLCVTVSKLDATVFRDGNYAYCIRPKVEWDEPAYIQMAIETYDWNPIPEDGGLVDTGTWEQRTTMYDWVRTWELVDEPAARAGTTALSEK